MKKLINGKPLIYYTINQALKSQMFDNIVVSTESKIVADEVKKMGIEVWFLRPTKFANDNSSKIPVIRHALLESEKHFYKNFDIIVDLDVT